ncbi:MAG: tRNA guanosine(34) transglycosylase Tgt [Planctomycetota bacterium]
MPAWPPLSFEIIARDSETRARRGCIRRRGQTIATPVFMPVGTAGTVKAMMPRDLEAHGFGLILANTYHLLLRPGAEVIASLGGLHLFMGWEGAILTDSGGYQVYSLGQNVRVDRDGVTFRSHLDGASFRLTPEGAIATQHRLGSDIVMPLDECLGHPAARDAAERSAELTLAWLHRSVAAHQAGGSTSALFGIVQGGLYEEVRLASAQATSELPLDGFAIGGLSVGEEPAAMVELVATTAPVLPEERPRYLMGVGRPEDLLDAIAHGIDMFDCVLPTRNARNAQVFTRRGPLKLRHTSHRSDPAPIDPDCRCYTCRRFSRAYLRHLFNAGEILASVLATIHNLAFYAELMEGARRAIEAGRFAAYRTTAKQMLGETPPAPDEA